MKTKYLSALLLLFCSPLSAELNVDTPLNFGEIAVRDNNTVSTVSISRNGNQTSTNQIFIIKPGTPGVYTLSGLPPFATINLSVQLPILSAATFPGARFSITAIDMPASVRTDATGSVQFRMGATLSTSGDPAENYQSVADYLVFINIDLAY